MISTYITVLTSLVVIVNGAYNPIPVGTVIISTSKNILTLQPVEYGGKDELRTIFTAENITIVNTIFDPTLRNLYVLFTNKNNSTVYISKLESVEQLSPISYQLPILYNETNTNNLNQFFSDVVNQRAFYIDGSGEVELFLMSGVVAVNIRIPSTIQRPIRAVAFNNKLNRFFVVNDIMIYSCANLDINEPNCCELSAPYKLNFIVFNEMSSDSTGYVVGEASGFYKFSLDPNNCPTEVKGLANDNRYKYGTMAINNNLIFASVYTVTGNKANLLIYNTNTTTRSVSMPREIIAIHVSYPSADVSSQTEETCFHGITYSDYRVAVVLAAVFGTVMGIFMCFNALFCIDFFMTKNIIRNLKKQIPDSLLEDRWNKLVEEKYAKIALEKQRKKDDPPPKNMSIAATKKISVAAPTTNQTAAQSVASKITETLKVPESISKIPASLRRKSENYFNRRRSDDYRSEQRHIGADLYQGQTHLRPPAAHIEPLQEESESRQGIRSNVSQRQLLHSDEDFL